MRDEGVAVGFLDGRYKLDERDDLTAAPKQDASKVIGPAYKSGTDEIHAHRFKRTVEKKIPKPWRSLVIR